jgi:hypothetical protein
MNGVSNLFAAAPAKRVRRFVIRYRPSFIRKQVAVAVAVAVAGKSSAPASTYGHSFSRTVLKDSVAKLHIIDKRLSIALVTIHNVRFQTSFLILNLILNS